MSPILLLYTRMYIMICMDGGWWMDVGCVWRLGLDYQKIAQSWPASQQTKLIDFLLKRATLDSKILILSTLQDLCLQQSSLHLLSRLFRMLNSTLYQWTLEQNQAAQQTRTKQSVSLSSTLSKTSQNNSKYSPATGSPQGLIKLDSILYMGLTPIPHTRSHTYIDTYIHFYSLFEFVSTSNIHAYTYNRTDDNPLVA